MLFRSGSDASGVVLKVGTAVRNWKPGDRVTVHCNHVDDQDQSAHDDSMMAANQRIWGYETNFGGLADLAVVKANQLMPKPAHLTWEEAAALPLAGLTAYRAVFSRGNLQSRERILISGIGGGVAQFALQFAVAAGAEVWVTSSSGEKNARAVALGAKGGFDYNAAGWPAQAVARVGGGFDVIVDSAGGEGFGRLIDAASSGGRIVFFGATRGDAQLPVRKVFWRQITLLGTTMGSPSDWAAMTAFVAEKRIRPVVSEIFPLARAGDAFALMERGGQFGKIVVAMA